MSQSFKVRKHFADRHLAQQFADERKNDEPSWTQVAGLWAIVIVTLVITGIV